MRVLVSGAGIAGPTLAFFLAKTGARVTVLEKSRMAIGIGQNVDIQGSARKVIRKMGLLDEVARLNTTEQGTNFIRDNGTAYASFPVNKSLSFTNQYEILGGDLANLFYQSTKDLQNVDYEFGITVKNKLSNDCKAVKVELSDGRIENYDLLVAADGQWSPTRKLSFPPETVTTVDKQLYAIYGTVPKEENDTDFWSIYHALDSRVCSLRPDPYNTMRACLTIMPLNDEQAKEWKGAARSGRERQQELLRKAFEGAGWQADRLVNGLCQAEDFYFQAIEQIRMSHWSNERVVCLGDAAWAPTPLTGMGTSLAITGAYVLAGELSKVVGKEGDILNALEAYEKAFKPFVEDQQKLPSFIPGIAHPASSTKRWIFQTCVQTASRIVQIPFIAKRFMQHNDKEDDFVLPVYPAFEEQASI